MDAVLAQVHAIHDDGVNTTTTTTGNAEIEQNFTDWLRDNGAEFGGVDWPSRDTAGRVRGAVARRDIATWEHMVVIPHHLMLSVFHARADPDTGHVYREKAPLLKSDNGLAIYIMQEMLKGESSFYWPYLRILPVPSNLRHWSEPDLLELQEPRVARWAATRTRQLRMLYRDTMEVLSNSYPGLFPTHRYTFELFDFAWSTLQARAFGRRLKCSALVPFADCLNHGNVQTKYDFDVEGNGVFRLFPTGTNCYPQGTEVLNSYGRRANDILLLDYGFTMLDNPWDAAEVTCSLLPGDTLFERRKARLRASGQHTFRKVRIRRGQWSSDLLQFNRCACLAVSELNQLEAQEDARSADHPSQARPGADVAQARKVIGSARQTVTYAASESFCSRPGADFGDERTAKGMRLPLDEEDACGSQLGSDEPCYSNASRGFPGGALSVENELAALTEIVVQLLEARDIFPTKLESDERLIREVNGDAFPELLNALKYRVTIKRILAEHLGLAERAIAFVQDIKQELESICDATVDHGNTKTDTWDVPTHPVQDDDHVPISFKTYLEDLRGRFLALRAPSSATPGGMDGGFGCETRRLETASFCAARVLVDDSASVSSASTGMCSRSAAGDSRPKMPATSSVPV